MDDELGFSSVWDSSPKPSTQDQSVPLPQPNPLHASHIISLDNDNPFSPGSAFESPPPHPPATTFDDFDDFGEPAEVNQLSNNDDGDDDFGDFGDFGDAEVSQDFDDDEFNDSSAPFDSGDFGGEHYVPPDPGPSNWEPLRLRPTLPSVVDLTRQVEELLEPLYGQFDPLKAMSDDPIRQVEGVAQILASPQSRSLYAGLMAAPSQSYTQPPNWTRSRIRRQHLISLGIPVNLDEVSSSKSLPALQITTRPMSAPPGPRLDRNSNGTNGAIGRGPLSRSGTPVSGISTPSRRTTLATTTSLSIGPKPSFDRERVERALALEPESLALLPLASLQAQADSLRSLTVSTSDLLSHLLQTREALQQDSETYNKLIAELVGEAQKMKGGGKGKPMKRGSAFG